MRLLACALGLEAQLRAIEVAPGGSLSERGRSLSEVEMQAQEAALEGTQRLDSGVHTCACVTAQDETRRDLTKLRWLHFPKTGTSFWSTLYAYACREKGPIDANVSPVLQADGCHVCYDFALMERYPTSEYCAADSFQTLETGNKYCPEGGCPETQHRPLEGAYNHIARMQELAHLDDPGRTVAMFREPGTRLESAAQNAHMAGMETDEQAKVTEKCGTPPDADCFAAYPGISGCMTRMLTGGTCADGHRRDPQSARRVDPSWDEAGPYPVNQSLAIERMRQLAFVGLTEEWNDAVCLFHKMFGGKVMQAEFKNFHRTGSQRPGKARDPIDEPLYAAAKQRFRELQKQYGAEQCYALNTKACEPQTCEDRGAECHATQDGCGTSLDCGECPQYRAGSAQCAEGKCAAQEPHADGTFALWSYPAAPAQPHPAPL